jgi:hypothetical protein
MDPNSHEWRRAEGFLRRLQVLSASRSPDGVILELKEPTQ